MRTNAHNQCDVSMTRKELAVLGERLCDNGRIWKTTLRAFASPPNEFGNERHLESVKGQIWAEAQDCDSAKPEYAAWFAQTFKDTYELESFADVDDLLGRESHERDNYEGQLAMVRSRSDDEIVDSILDNLQPSATN